MPLTISHPAASVPLRRFGLALSPLIIGSMAPDFAKFATLSPACDFGHSWLGAFWFSIPAGLIVLRVFHSYLKHPLFGLLPLSHQKRLIPFLNLFSFKPAKQFYLVLLGLLLGAFTHQVWDEFTHRTNLTVRWLPTLNTKLFDVSSYEIRVYKLLQHGSTLFGFALLSFWYFRWFQKSPECAVDPKFLLNTKTKAKAILSIIGSASVLGLIYGLVCATRFSHSKFLKIFLGRSVVAFGAVLAIALLVYCIIWNRRKKAEAKFPQQNV